MRLDFNILWIEDQRDAVKAQAKRIDYLVRKEGFRLQTEFAASIKEAKKYLASDIFGDHIDLILMDYDLGTGPKGDDGLLEVRKTFPYKDIIFYSARAADLLALMAKKKIQGVFCSDRDGLPDTVAGVCEALVKKVLDIDHSRGIIMGTTSDIDNFVNDCLGLTCDEGKIPENALKIIAKRMAEIRTRFEKDAAAIATAVDMATLLKIYNLYTSVDRLNLLRKVLSERAKYDDQCKSMKTYVTDTIPRRNILAHVRVQREGFSRRLIYKNGKEFTSQEMKKLRVELLAFQEMFEGLVDVLKMKE